MRVETLVLLLLIPSSPVFAQSAPEPAAPSPADSPAPVLHLSAERSRELSLAVHAISSGGPAPASIEAGRLIVRVDGQPVTPVKITAAPRSLIFVIDTINSSLQQLLRVRDALQSFLLLNGGQLDLPTSIVVFSDHKLSETANSGTQNRELTRRELFAQRFAPTPDGGELSRKLQQLSLGFSRILPSQGPEGQMERVSLSLRSLAFLADSQVTVPGVKLVVWISPGWPPMLESRQPQASVFTSAAFFAEALQQSRIMLNVLNSEPVIDVQTANFWGDAVRFPRTPAAARPNGLALQVLALQSGGRLLGNERTIAGNLATCVQDARSLFLLTIPAPAPVAASPVHELSLDSMDPGLQLRTRPAFVMLPGVAQPKPSN